jgi:hypothetical protein
VREIRTQGSVRGVGGNSGPYRDREIGFYAILPANRLVVEVLVLGPHFGTFSLFLPGFL